MRRWFPAVAVGLCLLIFTTSTVGAASPQWEWLSPRPTGAVLHGVAYGGGRFVAAGAGGTILSSLTGAEWTPTSSGTNLALRSVAYGAGRFVAVGGTSGQPYRWVILTSPDGMAWEEAAAGEGAELQQVIFAGDLFVAVGGRQESFANSTGLLLTSADGLDWTDRTWPDSPPLTGVAYGNGRYVAASSGVEALFASADAKRWEVVRRQDAGIWNYRRIDFGGGQFFAAVRYADSFVSADGLAWTETAGTGFAATAVWAGDRFFTESLSHSPDGATWSEPAQRPDSPDYAMYDLIYAGGLYVAVGQNLLATSPDGGVWTSRRTGPGRGLADIAVGGGRYVAVGSEGVVVTSDDREQWRVVKEYKPLAPTPWYSRPNLAAVAFGAGVFVAVGSPRDLIYTSSDGESWTEQMLFQGGDTGIWDGLADVIYAEDRFVAVGTGESLVSTDGFQWQHSEPVPGARLTSITHDGTRYIAVGNTAEGLKGGVWASADGLAWTALPAADLPPLRSVAHMDGRLVAVGNWQEGDVNTYAFVSTDGEHWERSGPLDARGSVSVAGDHLWLSAQERDQAWLLTSADGLTWSTVAIPAPVQRVIDDEGRLLGVGGTGAILSADLCGGFADMDATEPSCSAVRTLVQKGVIAGYPDGTFMPAGAVTRAELAKILVTVFGQAPLPTEPVPFADAQKHWAAAQGFLQAAVALKAVGGYPDGSFRPDAPVTRAELLKMVTATAGYSQIADAGYADVTPADWFAWPVALAAGARLVGSGAPTPLWTGPLLEPDRPATRAEVAILITNMLIPQR